MPHKSANILKAQMFKSYGCLLTRHWNSAHLQSSVSNATCAMDMNNIKIYESSFLANLRNSSSITTIYSHSN